MLAERVHEGVAEGVRHEQVEGLAEVRGPREPLEPLLLIIEFDRVLERFSPMREGSNGMIRWFRRSEFSGPNRDNRKPAG